MEKRRVVITGLGTVNPLGNNVSASWDAAMAGKCGIGPTIHYEQPDPECDLDYVPNTGRSMKMEYALSNSLGFGGHNACLVFRKWEG